MADKELAEFWRYLEEAHDVWDKVKHITSEERLPAELRVSLIHSVAKEQTGLRDLVRQLEIQAEYQECH